MQQLKKKWKFDIKIFVKYTGTLKKYTTLNCMTVPKRQYNSVVFTHNKKIQENRRLHSLVNKKGLQNQERYKNPH